KAIGYKELIPYFKGTSSLDECIEKIKLETRHYAKRQLTWFRRNEKINWIKLDKSYTMEKILYECKKVIAK
ncbi:MAG: tRNA (adenosine(37)-N6)-dimethylallyltransferase MiaA, partial [Clostridiales bacterium]|nr:tRNA (adenosine(37)-N6)-dimethylallyltransferase MiaA [Clostridiales bacterium]